MDIIMPITAVIIFGSHIVQNGEYPSRIPIFCPPKRSAQYMTDMIIPIIKPAVCPLFFAKSPSGTARKIKQSEPSGMENFL
jgi:hypothetical protein